MTVVINNPRQGVTPPPAPRKADGTPYRYEMIFEGGNKRGYSDSISQLCELIIPGYREEDDNPDPVAKVALRLKYAVTIQVQLQAYLLSDASEEDLAATTPEEVALMEAPKDEPPHVEGGVWQSPIPLVLVEGYYQPYTELPRPVGKPRSVQSNNAASGSEAEADSNLIWLNSLGETELLFSLHREGFIHLAERKASSTSKPEPASSAAPSPA